jgi:hypothetical protein
MNDQLQPCCKKIRKAERRRLAGMLPGLALLLITLFATAAYGHGVAEGDASCLERVSGHCRSRGSGF